MHASSICFYFVWIQKDHTNYLFNVQTPNFRCKEMRSDLHRKDAWPWNLNSHTFIDALKSVTLFRDHSVSTEFVEKSYFPLHLYFHGGLSQVGCLGVEESQGSSRQFTGAWSLVHKCAKMLLIRKLTSDMKCCQVRKQARVSHSVSSFRLYRSECWHGNVKTFDGGKNKNVAQQTMFWKTK